MTVLITGATGTVGRHVVGELRAREVPMRAFVRDRSTVPDLLGADVELVVGDFGNPDSLAAAMVGVDRVFLACGNVPQQVAYECAAVDAARTAGVGRVVKLSGPRADVNSPLLFERWHGEIERHLQRAGLPSVVIRPGPYLTQILGFAEAARHTGAIYAPAGSAPIAYVDPRDVAAVAATALAEDGHEGRTYQLPGAEAVTYAQIAAALSAATGRHIAYMDVPEPAARQTLRDQGVPALIADEIVAFFALMRAGGLAQTSDLVRTLTGREPRTLAQFAREHAAAFAGSDVEARTSVSLGTA